MELLDTMSLEEKIGQLICGRFGWDDVEEDVAEGRVGSIYGLLRDMDSATAAAERINHLQSIARYPLLFCGEQEHGSHLNFPGGTEFPAYMAIGATRSRELAYLFGKVNTLEGRAVGYNWISCPTVDVNIAPENPIINTRSLGEDPQLVTELGMESCRAIVEHRGLTCVCHCPGHGDTTCDSHAELPTVDRSADELWEVELAPYRATIPTGYFNCIMTAHIYYPAWEPEANLPATLSRNIMTGIIRERLGHDGLIATDGMGMKAIADNYTSGEAAIRALLAGCDIQLSPNVAEVSAALAEAIEAGRIPLAELDAAVSRILRAKEWLGLFDEALVDVSAVDDIVGCAEHRAIAKRVAQEAVTLLRGEGLPLSKDARLVVITGSEDDALVGEMRKRSPAAEVFAIGGDEDAAAAVAAAREADGVIIGLATSVRAYDEESVRGNQRIAALAQEIVATGRHTSLLVMGNPYVAADLPDASVCLCTYSACDDSVAAAAGALFGEFVPSGRLPVTVSEEYPFGFGL